MTDIRRSALITGAAKRVGRALAQGLVEDGWDIAIHYNGSADSAEDLATEIRGAGRRAITVQADLTNPELAQPVVQKAVEELGPLSLLINNASVFDDGKLQDLSLDSWNTLLNANLATPVFLMKAFANQASVPTGASIVNIVDQQISHPNSDFFAYFISKIGLEGATRLGGFGLGPKIRVNAVAPGLTLPSWGQSQEEFLERQNLVPLKQGLGPDDLLHAVRYLIGAKRVTGQVIFVDSGQRLMGLGNSEMHVAAGN